MSTDATGYGLSLSSDRSAVNFTLQLYAAEGRKGLLHGHFLTATWPSGRFYRHVHTAHCAIRLARPDIVAGARPIPPACRSSAWGGVSIRSLRDGEAD